MGAATPPRRRGIKGTRNHAALFRTVVSRIDDQRVSRPCSDRAAGHARRSHLFCGGGGKPVSHDQRTTPPSLHSWRVFPLVRLHPVFFDRQYTVFPIVRSGFDSPCSLSSTRQVVPGENRQGLPLPDHSVVPAGARGVVAHDRHVLCCFAVPVSCCSSVHSDELHHVSVGTKQQG